tara:strand:+ start:940 stop:1122 length:183 start_codon:yes stop_codon:yes gene_type:complete
MVLSRLEIHEVTIERNSTQYPSTYQNEGEKEKVKRGWAKTRFPAIASGIVFYDHGLVWFL